MCVPQRHGGENDSFKAMRTMRTSGRMEGDEAKHVGRDRNEKRDCTIGKQCIIWEETGHH